MAAHAAEARRRERPKDVSTSTDGQLSRDAKTRAEHLGELDDPALLEVVEVEVLVARAAVNAGPDDEVSRRRLPLVYIADRESRWGRGS